MYHIKKDKRSEQSVELIASGFIRLLETMPYTDVSIKGICTSAGVGRSTFYRNFDDKSDVLVYKMDTTFLEMYDIVFSVIDIAHISEKKLFELFFAFWLNEKSLVLLLINAKLYDRFQEMLLKFIQQKLLFIKEFMAMDDRSWSYFAEVRSAMLSAALQTAITRFPYDSPANIADTLHELFGNQKLL